MEGRVKEGKGRLLWMKGKKVTIIMEAAARGGREALGIEGSNLFKQEGSKARQEAAWRS